MNWWLEREADGSHTFRSKFAEVKDVLEKIMEYSDDIECRKLASQMLKPLQKSEDEEEKRKLKEIWK